MRLSVGIPVHDEQDAVPALLPRVLAVLDALPGGPHQLVIVDDGSRDGTRALLLDAAAHDSRITVVVLSRNFGHQPALSAAIDHVDGDAAVLMDGDLQDEPELIPRMVQLHLEGADVVYVRRASRQEGALHRMGYRVFYRLVAALSDTPLPLDTGDFALLGRPVLDALRQMPEHQRYLRGLRAWVGFTQVGLDAPRAARHYGRPKYTIWRLVTLALDGICSFSVVPLRAASLVGLLAMGAAGLFGVYALYVRLVVGVVPVGFTASLLVTIFLAGVQLLFLGVIGEYLGRIYNETKRRPHYVVARVVRRD